MKRFVAMLADIARRYPDLWRNIDAIRAGRGEGPIADWPEWCFIPDHLTSTYIEANRKSGNRSVLPNDPVLLPALAAWRSSQAVFHFSDALFERLTAENVGEASCLPLLQLPVWCCYVETPGAKWTGAVQDGFFVYVTSVNQAETAEEGDGGAREGRTQAGPELRIIPCAFPQRTFVSLPLPVGAMSVDDAIEASLKATAARKNQKINVALARGSAQWREYSAMMHKMLSLALYLCGRERRFTDAGGKSVFSGNPAPKRTKQGMRIFPADRPRLWLVDEAGQ